MTISTISPADFRNLPASGRPLNILDVRTRAEFARVHAAGARSVPLDELDPAAIAAEHREPGEAVYLICQSGARAAKACRLLQEAGVTHAYSIVGGTTAWEKMGLPVERDGGNVISLERQVRIGAGLVVLLGVTLAWMIHPAFVLIAALVGAGLVFAGITDFCGLALVLGKMPWNRSISADSKQCSRG